jgi:hypothetical protein
MNLPAVAAENLAFFAVGLSVGLLAGGLIGWAERRAQFATWIGSIMSGLAERIRPRLGRAVAYFVVGVLVFGLGVYTGFRVLEQKYGCVNDYANELADSLEPRQKDGEALQAREQEARATENKAWTAVAAVLDQQDPDAAALKVAVANHLEASKDYLEAAEALNATRTKNPYPPAPREAC